MLNSVKAWTIWAAFWSAWGIGWTAIDFAIGGTMNVIFGYINLVACTITVTLSIFNIRRIKRRRVYY